VTNLESHIFVTQVVPFVQPSEDETSVVYDEYVADLARYCADCEPGFGSMEGYLGARMVLDSLAEVEYLRDFSLDLDAFDQLQEAREAFLDNLYFGSSYSAGDLHMGPFHTDCNQGLYSVFLTSIRSESGLYLDHPDWAFHWDTCNANLQLLPDEEIPVVFGQSAAFSGVAADLGREMREGIQGALNAYNQHAMRKAYLLTCDDGYEPDKAEVCLNYFLENENVLGMVGSVGTPTAIRMVDTVLEQELPWVGPFTGARFLRSPFKRPVMNVRASYDDEVAAMVQYLVDNNRAQRISILYQNDGFGTAGYNALKLALDFHLRDIYSEGTYERNTVEVHDAIESIFPSDDNDVEDIPDAVIMIGTALPLAKFVRDSVETVTAPAGTESRCDAGFPIERCVWFYTVSFVGSVTLANELGSLAASEKVYISQVVPIPSEELEEESPEFMGAYTEALDSLETAEFGKVEMSLGSMEGFITGSVLTQSLVDMASFTRSSLIDSFYSVNHNVHGLNIGPFSDKEGEECNQGLRFVIVSKIDIDIQATPMYQFKPMYELEFPDECGVLQYFAPPDCQNGTETIELFPGENSKAICQECSRGFFSIHGEPCQACPVGFTSDSLLSSCLQCAPGSYAPDVGSYACLECPAGKYNDAPGSHECYECPANADGTIGASNRSACTCRPGFTRMGDEDDWECVACNSPDWSIPGRPCMLPPFESQTSMRVVMCILAALSVSLCLVAGVLVYQDRRHIIYKATSYRFLIVNIIGAAITQTEVFLGFFYEPTVYTCSIIPFVHSVGFGLMLGSVIVKEWRVVQIFSTVFYRRRLSDQLLYKYLAAIVFVGVLNNSVTSIASPVSISAVDSHTLYASFQQCSSSHDFTWVSSKAIYDVLLILVSLSYAWQARKVPSKYSETKMMQVLYNFAICCLLDMTLPLVIVSPDAAFAVHAGMLMLMSCTNVGLLFLPKWIVVHSKTGEEGSLGSRKSMVPGSVGSDGLYSSASDFTVDQLIQTLLAWKEGKPFPSDKEKKMESLLLRMRTLDVDLVSGVSGVRSGVVLSPPLTPKKKRSTASLVKATAQKENLSVQIEPPKPVQQV
jgi:ABC-type branched-subunit amino acid transport system substrate-binding protein